MEEVEFDVCPNCGSEDTNCDEDWVYDHGYSVRVCDGCMARYKVYWKSVAVRKEVL